MPSRSSPAEPGAVLLVQTTGGPARLGLGLPGGGGSSVLGTTARAAAAELPGLLAGLLEEAGDPSLAALGVVVGPGSFTGIKVGMAFGRGLARARGLKARGLHGFRLLAGAAGRGRGLAAVDALRGEALVQGYAGEADRVELVGSPELRPWGDLDPGELALDPDLAGPFGDRAPDRARLVEVGLALLQRGVQDPFMPVWTRPTWAEEKCPPTGPKP